jgi:hypothetical protein
VSLATIEESARRLALAVNDSIIRSSKILPSPCATNIIAHIVFRMHSMLENQDNVHGDAMQLEISLDTLRLYIKKTYQNGDGNHRLVAHGEEHNRATE